MKRYFKVILIVLMLLFTLSFRSDLFVAKKNKEKIDVSIELGLLGKEKTTLEINQNYKEEGAFFRTNGKNRTFKISGFVNSKKVGKYNIKYDFYLSDFKLDTKYREVSVIDTTAPVIQLKGSKNYKVALNSKYEEPGYTVTDNSEEDLTKKVNINGKVDTKKAGKYQIRYSVEDSSGNKSEVVRYVLVQIVIKNTSMKVTKVSQAEKGGISTTKINLLIDLNTTTNMKFTSSGISMTGYVKLSNSNYIIKLCDLSNKCINTNMKAKDSNYYTGKIDLINLENNTYFMKIVGKTEMDVINKLSEFDRINRAKVGNKLITIIYYSNKVKIKVEDFKYQYDILIDPGHGGSDSGTINSTITEKTLNLKQSQYEKSRYEAHGLKVFMIRNDDTYGIMMGSSNEVRVRRRSYAIGYYGAVSRVIYSNHHNSIGNNYFSGWEIITPALATSQQLSPELKIASDLEKEYLTTDIHTRFYTRNYDTGSILNKRNGQTYNVKNYYAVIRIPYELFNVKNVLYEGCYLSNNNDFNWYYKENNWKEMSEIKIKHYVESLGVTYIAP